MSYLIYLRKSRKDIELESLGIDVLERHEKTLLEYAKAHQLPIGAIYREVVSGDSIDNRPQMQRLLSEVESGIWDGVLVMEVERLARGDTIDQGRVQRAFFYSSTLIVTPAKVYNPANEYDNEYFEFSLFMSRREYATIKRRMQRGRVRSAQDGYFVGNIPPYGWKRVKADDGKHFTLTPDEQEKPILQMIYDLIGNKQYGYQRTCTYLTNLGVRARSGKPFNPATLKGIVSNPVNIGKIRWEYRKTQKNFENGVVVVSRPKAKEYILADAQHKGVIDPELFERANTVKNAFTTPVRHDRPIRNIFAGILYCSCCGHVMVRKIAHTKTPYDYMVCNYTGCKTVSVKSADMEDALIKWLKDYTTTYDAMVTDFNDDAIQSQQHIVKDLQDRLDTLLKQRSSLFDLLEQGIYTKEIFLARSNELEDRIKKCSNDIKLAEDALAQEVAIKKDRANFAPRCQKALESWDSLDVAEKNSVLKTLVEKIVFTKTERNTRSNHDAVFSIDVFPKVSR